MIEFQKYRNNEVSLKRQKLKQNYNKMNSLSGPLLR